MSGRGLVLNRFFQQADASFARRKDMKPRSFNGRHLWSGGLSGANAPRLGQRSAIFGLRHAAPPYARRVAFAGWSGCLTLPPRAGSAFTPFTRSPTGSSRQAGWRRKKMKVEMVTRHPCRCWGKGAVQLGSCVLPSCDHDFALHGKARVKLRHGCTQRKGGVCRLRVLAGLIPPRKASKL